MFKYETAFLHYDIRMEHHPEIFGNGNGSKIDFGT